VQGTGEQFIKEVLSGLAEESKKGFTFLREHSEARGARYVPLVSQLAAERPKLETEYLLGGEPQWSDVITGRAIERLHDQALLEKCEGVLVGKSPATAVAITGTAGTGKSTALMSLALKLSSKGVPVLWIDKDSDVGSARIKRRVREARGAIALAIDDADMFGRELINLLSDLVPERQEFLFVFATRSSKVDSITSIIAPDKRLRIQEHVVPPLNDSDIDGLIAVLAKNSRLGVLTGASADARRSAFRDQAGRQLLVAMIQATSGENFERKAENEYLELEGTLRYVYALIVVATSMRHTITKDEVLLACEDNYEEALIALDRLAAHHLVVLRPALAEYKCRHRVIADIIFDKLKELGELREVLVGLAWALASKIGIPLDRHSQAGKFLIRLINHDFLLHAIGFHGASDLYSRVEPILSAEYHFWLQRGSLEVEVGDIRRAENFLGAARSLAADDFRVGTAYAYMLMRKACEAPHDLHAEEYLQSGMKDLEDIIENWGYKSHYPYHVLGSQGLAWAHRGISQKDARRTFIEKLEITVSEGLTQHPMEETLVKLRESLRREILLTTIPDKS